MYSFIDKLVGFNHFFIVSILMVPVLFFLFYRNLNHLSILLFFLISFNLLSFYSYLYLSDSFDPKVHLPLHLCYITEFAILLNLFLKNQFLLPWLFLNSVLGGIVGFVNSNLTSNSLDIEYVHYYLSHFNLILFSIIFFKSYVKISFLDLVRSIYFNATLLFSVFCFNYYFQSNYWFTFSKPIGTNLSIFFPQWPYYLFFLIFLGLLSYSLTFIFLLNRRYVK
tara:strand:+ start:1210 stop:1878 length:669 start_codon:yes stop_codon:yes gene_type:complete